jgi:opacity protein-like surface antigen
MRQIQTILFGVILAAAGFASDKAHAWASGCGVQVHGGHAIGEINGGGPVGLSSTGYLPGVSAFCDLAIGKFFAVGVFAGAEQAFGDFDKLGINHSIEAGARAGISLHPAVLAYMHAAWVRIDVDGLGGVDGMRWGPGVEIALPESKGWSVDFRYQISDMDVGNWTGADAQVRSFRLGLAWKFGGGQQVESIFTPEASKPCDKKLGNCK